MCPRFPLDKVSGLTHVFFMKTLLAGSACGFPLWESLCAIFGSTVFHVECPEWCRVHPAAVRHFAQVALCLLVC